MNLAVRGIDADIRWNSEGSVRKDELRDLKGRFCACESDYADNDEYAKARVHCAATSMRAEARPSPCNDYSPRRQRAGNLLTGAPAGPIASAYS